MSVEDQRTISEEGHRTMSEEGHRDSKCSLLSLPSELVEKIFLYLDVKDIARLSCVCISWREIANIDHIW
jgi:hypothetical protein